MGVALAECASSDRIIIHGRRLIGACMASVGRKSSADDGAGSRQNQNVQKIRSNQPWRARAARAAKSLCS